MLNIAVLRRSKDIMPETGRKPRTRWGSGRIAVVAKWPEIQTAVLAGWPLTMIFEKHMSTSEISYSQFRRQVHRLQAAAAPTSSAAIIPPQPTGNSDAASTSNPGDFAKNYDPSIDPIRLGRLIGKPKN